MTDLTPRKSEPDLRAKIGALMGDSPCVDWAVANADMSAFCLMAENRSDVQGWFDRIVRDHPDGWLATGGWHVVPVETWPDYLSDRDAAMRFASFAFLRLGSCLVQARADGGFRVAAGDRSAADPSLCGALARLLGLEDAAGETSAR
jgi:hypothetical protein